ncbi:MAG: Adaptive-response sensory-kinase SasA [Bacteroidota bacterium]
MQFSKNRNTWRWTIIAVSFVIVVLILLNTYSFFQIFKNEERIKMEQWAEAQKTIQNAGLDTDIALSLKIIQNTKIPIMVIEKDSLKNSVNIDEKILADSVKQKLFLQELKSQNKPIIMEYFPGKKWNLYYGDSDLLKKLKYYPLGLVLIIVLFGTVVFNFYQSTKMATENKLWAGMAKETAHQIGTPLSSLIGWLEIMKADNVNEQIVTEIEKDIARLQTITDRFSKIGSVPVLEKCDIVHETKTTFDYLKTRFSSQVEFNFDAPSAPLFVNINDALHSWTIENLIKNAIDAMKGRGKISVDISTKSGFVKINVSDTGKGIPKNQFKNVFNPGFTTKKRGWGLGLSLTKRIVEEYHNGKVKVLKSEIDAGTTMQILYKQI